MPNTRTYVRSFAGGEMSPEMFGRIDDNRFQTGAATMRNFIATPQGPAENRPGFKFVREVKDSSRRTRLIPFTYSTTQTMVIELGHLYIRFHTAGATLVSGGVPYEIASPYTEADLFDIKYVQSGDVLTLVHPTHAPRELRRLGLVNWTLTPISFRPSIQPPSFATITPSVGFMQTISTINNANPGVLTTSSSHELRVNDSIYISGVTGMNLPAGFYVVNSVGTGASPTTLTIKRYNTGVPINTTSLGTYTANSGRLQWAPQTASVVNKYVVTAISQNGIEESVPSLESEIANNLNVSGAFNTLKWAPVPTASRYNVYKQQSGLFGYIGSTDETEFVDDNIAPDLGVSPPIYDPTFVGGVITSVPVTAGGSGYGQTQTTLGSGGVILQVNVLNGGFGYTYSGQTPGSTTVTVNDPTGTGAVLTVNVLSVFPWRITSITVVNGGTNYTNPQFIINDGPPPNPFTLPGSGAVLQAILSQYQQPDPTIREVRLAIVDPTGFGAIIKPIIVNRVITGVNVIAGGYGYSNPAVQMVDAAGGSGATFGTPVFTTAQYPGSVSYFEQRRVFASTPQQPQSIWMTRSGTESDLSYSIPIKDSDRIQFRVAAREANTIRHIVPLSQLLLLTSAAEWRVSPVNSDAITPTTISVRPQAFEGSSNVTPWIVNNSVVYCAARGGHVRELGYSWQSNGYTTGDLSLRASHLFDDFEISDMCYSKAPQPILWFVSTSGKMLGLTYIPDQQIGAWHQHVTDGAFESCTAVAEGEEDVLYVVVRRTIQGSTRRYVERIATRKFADAEDAFFVDSGATYDGTNTGTTNVTISGGSTWDPTDTLNVASSQPIFAHPATTDVGDEIVIIASDGQKYRLRILSVSSTTAATARVDRVLPPALRNVNLTSWAWARDTISGLSHLEGKTVSILAEGAVMSRKTVTGGTITLDEPSYYVHAGLPYDCDLQTLPMTLNIDGFGQGRRKAINFAYLRVYRSGAMTVGPDETRLTLAKFRTVEPYGSPPSLKTEEVEVMVTPSWQDSGQVYVRQSDPLPLTVVNMTIEVAIGG